MTDEQRPADTPPIASVESKTSRIQYHISIAPAFLAADQELTAYLANLINDVYTIAERGIFSPEYRRTTPSEVATYISSGSLALGSTSSSSPWSPPSTIQGCIRILQLSPTQGEIGMIVAAPSSRGTGLGKQLVDFGEAHCRAWGAESMKLELLVPIKFRHELKSWIQPWYERLGYEVVGLEDFGKHYPRIAEHVVTECEYRVFVKKF